MMKKLLILFGLLLATPVLAAQEHTVVMHNLEGEIVGTVALKPSPLGTLVHGKFSELKAGTHAIHIHETGSCETPFTSAGGHYNPYGTGHGFMHKDGHHAGDLPNIHMPGNGILEFEHFSSALKIDENLLDEDGAAIIVHEGADDYKSQPSGAAGARIACGVIKAK